MNPIDRLRWQWSIYPENHQDRRNLVIHIFAVPLFIASFTAVILSPWLGWGAAVAGVVGMPVAMMLQGRGHRLERVAPAPFDGPRDVVVRIFGEQLYTFPRFVVTGGWARALRGATPPTRL